MNLKNLFVKLIRFYQLFISPMLGNNCRYYPSCSEYALLEFKHDSLIRAILKTTKRVLSCNQLFRGGIDFPVVKKKITHYTYKKAKIKYWFIPTDKKEEYIVIKAENGQ